MKEAVERFLSEYIREQSFYEFVARKCAEQCESLLRTEGIRAIVTSRAKRPDSLLEKLHARDATKNYKNSGDIRADLVDLAGVRIAMYFPRDRERLGNVIENYFDLIKVKTFPIVSEDDDNSDFVASEDTKEFVYEKVFSGYHAQHYLVQLRKETLSPNNEYLSTGVIEIQAASVLMHAWSEVEHDLVYKPKNGKLSKNELSILDEVNGLILSGEIALSRLQEAGENRIRVQGRPFENQYELAIFLIDLHKKHAATDEEPSVGTIDVLLKILKQAKGDKPEFVEQLYEKIGEHDKEKTLSEQLISALKSQHPKEFGLYLTNLGIDDPANPTITRKPNYRGSFIVRMSQIRSFLSNHGIPADKESLSRLGIDFDDYKKLHKAYVETKHAKDTDVDYKSLSDLAGKVLRRLRTIPLSLRSAVSGRYIVKKER